MSKYREGTFRNSFEKNIFGKVKETCEWCIEFARSGYIGAVEASVFHNVQTADFHGVLSVSDTFAEPQSREIDILLEVYKPQEVRLLISCKSLAKLVQVDHISDTEALLYALRASSQGWLYWMMVVGSHGFQSGCEDIAKRADIPLVPPVTGKVTWLKHLTFGEIAQRVQDAIKVFLLGEAFWLDSSAYSNGNLYNAIFIVTREPSGMPGETVIQKSGREEVQMKDLVSEAITKKANKYRIPLSRGKTYIPLFKPIKVQGMRKNGTISQVPVRSITSGPPTGIQFFKIKTAQGRELFADGQRAMYVPTEDGSRRKLVRIDKLKVGTRIFCISDDETDTELDEVTEITALNNARVTEPY